MDNENTAGYSNTKHKGIHYAWVISALTFLVLLVAAGVRTAPAVFIKPFEAEFGWNRGTISLAVAVSILVFGLGGPLGGSLIDRFGPRKVMVGGLILILTGLGPLLALQSLWQLYIFWGLLTGLGTGALATVLGATVAQRWFTTHRGLIVGLFSAASSAGQLIFLPSLMAVTTDSGWRAALGYMCVALAALLLPVAFLMRDRPQDVKLRPVGDNGAVGDGYAHTGRPQGSPLQTEDNRTTPMRDALRTRDFWLLASSFFICGYTSNGLIGTHLVPHAIDHGFTETVAAGAVGVMGMMNIIGTLGSGWLTDRYDNRRLLAGYYGFRALGIAWLPFVTETNGLMVFAVLYGLDWIATVPPTVNLTAQRFGRGSVGTVFGWIFCAHMVGAALATYIGGLFHDLFGDYTLAFLSAAALGFVAVALSSSVAKVAPKAALSS